MLDCVSKTYKCNIFAYYLEKFKITSDFHSKNFKIECEFTFKPK